MYDKFLYYILIPILIGIMIAEVVDGTKKNRAELQYYAARTHQIMHELQKQGCVYALTMKE